MSAAISLTKKNLGLKPKPRVEVKLDDTQNDAFTPSFTSLDEINGEVSITCQTDLEFNDIYITFEGATRTYVEKIATTSPTNGKTEAFQNFLRLMQPLDPAAFPESHVLEAHKTYKFRFNFVVPEHLLPQSCTHPKSESFSDDAHLNLPPSLGDPMVAALGKSLVDDMCPDMATIIYSVKCRLTRGRSSSGKHMILAEGSKKVRIVPAVEEAPPLPVEGGEKDDYRMRKEKTIQRGMFRKKLGRLTAEAVQPKSLRLHSIRSDKTCEPTTMATVNIRFDPVDEKSEPPKLNALAVKLKVATFYASVPLREVPSKSRDFHYSSVKGLFVETVPLASRCLADGQWERHTPGVDTRENGLLSMNFRPNTPVPSCAYKGKSFYTAKVVAPVSLPKGNKVFVPTFHSCLMSRVYALDLYLSIVPPKATVTDPILHLKLPVQISCEPSPHAQEHYSRQEANAIVAQTTNEFFSPRNVAPPSDEYLSNSTISNPVSPDTTPRIGFESSSNPPSPRTRPTATMDSNRAHPTNPRISFSEDIPPSPGPGWSHRSSWAPGVIPDRPPQNVRMMRAQQRFQSLSFDDEDIAALVHQQDAQPQLEEEAPPPDYSGIGGRWRERVVSSSDRGRAGSG